MDQVVRLPFDTRMQLAVLGHLLTKNVFFQQARTRVKPEWFNDLRATKVYKALLKFWDAYKRLPTPDELKSSSEIAAEKESERSALYGTIHRALQETENYGLDVVRSRMTEWLHARIFRESHERSEKLYNEGKFSDCYNLVWDRINEIRSVRFDEDAAVSFADPQVAIESANLQWDRALTLGLKIFDDALVPDGNSKGGSLLPGDTTVFLAPSNVGKTSTIITTIAHNVRRRKDVLFFSHEGRKDDLRLKLLCSITRLPLPFLLQNFKNEHVQKLLAIGANLLEKHLVYIPWTKPGMVVEDLVPVIRRRQEERIVATGKGFDMLADDYPAKLGTERAKGGHLPPRAIECVVYDYFVQLALENEWHSLLAIQTNRSGSVANRDDERLLTMEDVRESWDVMTMATNVITINRDPKAIANKRVTYYVAKSRSSETGRAIVCKTNYAATVTHDEKLGGTWYRGTETMSDEIDLLLAQNNGKCCVPTIGGVPVPAEARAA